MWDWDEGKRAVNLAKHGVDLAEVADLDWTGAVTREDRRSDYGERRFVTSAPLHGRLHVCIWCLRDSGPRVIRLRKANPRERARHDAEKLH